MTALSSSLSAFSGGARARLSMSLIIAAARPALIVSLIRPNRVDAPQAEEINGSVWRIHEKFVASLGKDAPRALQHDKYPQQNL